MLFLQALVQTISAPSLLISAIVLSVFRFSRRTTIRTTAFAAALLLLTDLCLILFFGQHVVTYPILDFAYRIFNVTVVSVVILIITRQRFSQTLFTVLSVLTGISIVDTASLTIRALLERYSLELALELLLYLSIILVFVKIRKPFLHVVEYMKSRVWPLCLAPAFLLAGFLLQLSVPRRLVDSPENIPVALLLCFITVTVYVLFYSLFWAMYEKSALEHNAMAMALFVSSLEHQNELAAQNEKGLSLFKHDLRHFTQMLSVCLDNGDTMSARELLTTTENRIGEWGASAMRTFTGHKLFDATLCHYIGVATGLGIDITVSICEMDESRTDMTELTVVLANALENAIKACEKLPEGEPRVIVLDGHRRGKQYFLEIINTCDGAVTFDSASGLPLPVSDKPGHGYGSQSIAYFAEKNHAVLQYQLDGRLFRLRLLMNA